MIKRYGVFTIVDGQPVLISDHLNASQEFLSKKEAKKYILSRFNETDENLAVEPDTIFLIMPIYVN